MMGCFGGVIRICADPNCVRPHSFNAKVTILNELVYINIRWMLIDVARINIEVIGVGHAHRLDGGVIGFISGHIPKIEPLKHDLADYA
jgi:hypothetical protein